MLTPAQITSIKSVASPTAPSNSSNPSAVFQTPEDAKAAFSSGQPTPAPQQPARSNLGSDAVGAAADVAGGVGNLVGQTVQNIKDIQSQQASQAVTDFTGATKALGQGQTDLASGNLGGAAKDVGNAVLGGMGTAADAIKFFFAPLSGAIETGINENADAISNSKTLQGIATSPVADKVVAAKQAFDAAIQAHPDVQKALKAFGDAFTIASTAVAPEAGKAIDASAQGAKGSIEAGVNSVKGSMPTPDEQAAYYKGQVPPAKAVPEVDTLNRESGQVTPEAAQASAWKDIQPKATPTTKLAYAKAGNTTEQSMFKAGELKPSDADKKLLDSYGKMYEDGTVKDGMTPNEKQAAVQQKAAQLHGQQKDFLAKNDKAVVLADKKGGTGVFDALDKTTKKSSMPFAKDASAKGAYDSAIYTFKSNLDTAKSAGTIKGATTLSKLDAALTTFDQQMDKFGAWGKTKTGEMTDTAMARQQAIRDIHQTVRDYISNNLPKNSPWRAIRAEESNMYELSDRIAQRTADTVGQSKATQLIKEHPVIKTGIKAAGLGAGLHLIP